MGQIFRRHPAGHIFTAETGCVAIGDVRVAFDDRQPAAEVGARRVADELVPVEERLAVPHERAAADGQ